MLYNAHIVTWNDSGWIIDQIIFKTSPFWFLFEIYKNYQLYILTAEVQMSYQCHINVISMLLFEVNVTWNFLNLNSKHLLFAIVRN